MSMMLLVRGVCAHLTKDTTGKSVNSILNNGFVGKLETNQKSKRYT